MSNQDPEAFPQFGMSVGELVYAGFWMRFLAIFIDTLILFGVGLIIGLGAGILMIFAKMMIPDLVWIIQLLNFLVGLVINWLYSAYFESSEGQATLGKKICKLKVTDVDGQRLSFARATGRYFSKFLSGFLLCIGYIMAAFTPKKPALHDMFVGSLVVKA